MRKRFRFLPPVIGSYRFCSLRHASNGFFRELATMSFASYLVRTMSAVCICCSTNSRFCTPLSSFVSVGKNSRSIAVVVISVGCSAAHSNTISDSLITPAKNASVFFDHRWKSFSRPVNFLRTTEAFHINETRSVFPNLSCREIVDCPHCIGKSRYCLPLDRALRVNSSC